MLQSIVRTFYRVFFIGYVPYSFTDDVLRNVPQHLEAMRLASDDKPKRKEIASTFYDSMKNDEDRRTYQILIQPMAGDLPFDFAAYQARFAQYTPQGAAERERKALLSHCFVPLPLPSQVVRNAGHALRMRMGKPASELGVWDDDYLCGALYRGVSGGVASALTNSVQYYRGKRTGSLALVDTVRATVQDSWQGGAALALRKWLEVNSLASPDILENFNSIFAFLLFAPEILQQSLLCWYGRQSRTATACNLFEMFYKVATSIQEGLASIAFSRYFGFENWNAIVVSGFVAGVGSFSLRNAVSYQAGECRSVFNGWE